MPQQWGNTALCAVQLSVERTVDICYVKCGDKMQAQKDDLLKNKTRPISNELSLQLFYFTICLEKIQKGCCTIFLLRVDTEDGLFSSSVDQKTLIKILLLVKSDHC